MKCSIPKGTRDFLPVEMARRNYIFDTIRDVLKHASLSIGFVGLAEALIALIGKQSAAVRRMERNFFILFFCLLSLSEAVYYLTNRSVPCGLTAIYVPAGR